ncbi:MAG: CotH kinase family protein [Planctomycetota bacterium]|nr:CotH kinase family protein [Planctomycetota bacterium]
MIARSPRTYMALVMSLVTSWTTATAQTPDLYDLDKVREFRLYFSQSNYWTQLKNNYASKTNILADLKVDGLTYPKVGVRFRGNTSYRRIPVGSEKAGFNIETDVTDPDQDIYGYDHLNLNNGYHDPTFMREVLTYQIARRYMCAPKANFVKVYLNDQYWGIYINVQQPNKDMIEEWFRTNDGNRYRGFPSGGGRFDDSAFNYLGNVPSNYQRGYEFKQGDGTDLMNFITILTQTPNNQLYTALPKVFSVDQGYWYAVTMNILSHTDCYIGSGKDHMEYFDEIHGRCHIFPFDVNEAIGGQGGTATLDPYYNSTNPLRPMLSRTLPRGDWRARYNAHYRTVFADSYSWGKIGALITKYQNMIRADVVADTKKIYPTSAFTSNVTQDYGSGRNRIRGIRPLIQQRVSFLNGFASLTATEASLSSLGQSPSKPGHKQTVTITVKASGAASVSLYYRSKGPFIEIPMLDDGAHGDGGANDGVYGAFIPGEQGGTQVDYYTGAKTSAGVQCFLPRSAEFQSPNYFIDYPIGTSAIVLNEALAKNVSTNQDPLGEFDDWVELYNTSSSTVNVGGMYLSDKYHNSTKFQLPAGTTIAGGGTLLVWCDEDGSQGPLHANFKISGSGENLYLFKSDGKTLVFTLELGEQQDDISTGRLFDQKSSPLVTYFDPSPDALNSTGLGGVRRYSALDSTAHTIGLSLGGTPKTATQISIKVDNGPPSSAVLLMIATGAAYVPFIDGTVLLINGAPLQAVVPTSSSGSVSIPVTVPNTVGATVYLQTVGVGTSGLLASNGMELIVY